MKKPSIFSKDYEKIMRKRKRKRIVIGILSICIIGILVTEVANYDFSKLKDRLQAWVDEDKEKYADETASLSKSAKKSSVTNSSLADWLFTQDRKAGEVTVIEDTDNSAYIVAYFISRSYDESNNTTIANQLLSQKYNELITGYTDNMSVNNIKNRIKMLSE